jgi:hypothetical protein
MVFDRRSGEVVERTVYSDRHEALRARFEAERKYQDAPDIEVVVLAADSEDAVKRTHARYFGTLRTLFEGALNSPPLGRDARPASAPS